MVTLFIGRHWWNRRLRAAGFLWLALAMGWAGAGSGRAVGPDGFRKLSPGVLTVIPPDTSARNALERSDILEITLGRSDRIWIPKQDPIGGTFVERAKNRALYRDIWCLEFAFKMPRLIDVDVPAPDLQMRRKRLWYLVYRVKNVGGIRAVVVQNGPVTSEKFEKPIRFLPHFVLESVEGLSAAEGTTSYRAYLDRVVPSAVGPIRRREDPRIELFDSARMAETDIASGEERWGVAIWEDIDPRIDFFSIFVRGLSNAIRWREDPLAVFSKESVPGAQTEYALESLRLDFWRPGDERNEVDEEMQVGHAGLFESMSLGTKVLESFGRPRLTKSMPADGLDQLGLSWRDLLEPVVAADLEPVITAGAGGEIDRAVLSSLLPLEKVVKRLAAMKNPATRGPAVRNLLGDLGIQWLEELSRGLAAPLDPNQEVLRAASLKRIGVTPADLASQPLYALANVIHALDSIGRKGGSQGDSRQSVAAAVFGPAARRLESLAKEVAAARTLVVLNGLQLDRKKVEAGGPRAAFDAVRIEVAAESDQAKRALLLQGLFGPQGPALYAAATAVHEGIDHAWVFRYENSAGEP